MPSISRRRHRWEAYTGVSQKAVAEAVRASFAQTGIKHTAGSKPPNVMYDGEHETLTFTSAALSLSLYHVTADPVTRVLFGLLGSEDRLSPITLVSATYYETERRMLSRIVREIAARSEAPPWEIGQNPRFRHAIGLRAMNTAKWRRVLNHKSLSTAKKGRR